MSTLDPLKAMSVSAFHYPFIYRPVVTVAIIVIVFVIINDCPSLFLRNPHHEEEITPGL